MGRRRYIYVIRDPANVKHDEDKECRGYEYEPESDEYTAWTGKDDDVCPKCRWFYVKGHLTPWKENPTHPIIVAEFYVSLREHSDWWIGNHFEHIGKKDYRYSQDGQSVTNVDMKDIIDAFTDMRHQGAPIRPSDIELWEQSQDLVRNI